MLAGPKDLTVTQIQLEGGKTQTISGTGCASITEVLLLDENGTQVKVIDVGQSVQIQVAVKANVEIDCLVLGYAIKDRLGQVMYGSNTCLTKQTLVNVIAGERYIFDVNFIANLGQGNYSVALALTSSETHLLNNFEWRDIALQFSVVNQSHDQFSGCGWIEPRISISTN